MEDAADEVKGDDRYGHHMVTTTQTVVALRLVATGVILNGAGNASVRDIAGIRLRPCDQQEQNGGHLK